ncbi:MAG: hypothetical protein AAF617_04410 [Bacteroidota bacterium]
MKILKVKAGALQFAIMISAIIAVLLSVFIVFIHSHSMFEKKSDVLIETIQQTEDMIIANLDNFLVQKDTIIGMPAEEKNQTSKLHRSYWGVFGKVYSQVATNGKTVEKIALVSGAQSGLYRTALYLKETNSPLIVVGNAKIQGKTYLPKRGIKAGTIAGNSYYGTQLVHGTVLKSSETLPKLSSQLINSITTLQKLPLSPDNEQYIDVQPGKTYTNSFTQPVKTVFSNDALDISNVKLVGHILVRSNTKITVAASSMLTDVVLIAPEIEIESNVKGTFQAIASEQITVGKDCELRYPSALVMNVNDDHDITLHQEFKKHIFIDQNTSVKGIVCYLQNETEHRFEPQIMLKEHTQLTGFLYCEQQLELLGDVYGSVYTGRFITKQFGSIYQNHMYNGHILCDQLEEEYVGFPLGNVAQKVMKWLY